jgi:hypothetical protein
MQRRDVLKSSLASLLGLTFGYSGTANGEELYGCYYPTKKGLLGRNKECVHCLTQASSTGLFRANKWGGTNKKNGHTHLTYLIDGRDNDFAASLWDAEIAKSFNCWSEVTNVSFSEAKNNESVDIVIGVSRRRKSGFGRSGGVLAWAQLPSSPNYDGQLWSMFDTAESWTTDPNEENGILFRAVCAHEIGHLLGLDHSAFKGALMYPYYSASIDTPQKQDDIPRIQKLYGKIK